MSPRRAMSRLELATMTGFCPTGKGFGWFPASSETASPRNQFADLYNPTKIPNRMMSSSRVIAEAQTQKIAGTSSGDDDCGAAWVLPLAPGFVGVATVAGDTVGDGDALGAPEAVGDGVGPGCWATTETKKSVSKATINKYRLKINMVTFHLSLGLETQLDLSYGPNLIAGLGVNTHLIPVRSETFSLLTGVALFLLNETLSKKPDPSCFSTAKE